MRRRTATRQRSRRQPSPTRRQDFWYWRLFVTAFSFSLFGLGALVVGTILLPIVKLIPASRDTKRNRARAVHERGVEVVHRHHASRRRD